MIARLPNFQDDYDENRYQRSALVKALPEDALYIPVSAFLFLQNERNSCKSTNGLVLDACLRLVGESTFKRQLQAVHSEWLRRSWVLQETVLLKPENLLIQLRRTIIPLSSLIDEVIDQELSQVWHNLEVQTVHLLSKQFPKSAPENFQLLVLINTLQRHSTTKTEDEAICLATLMDVSLEQFKSPPSMDQVLGGFKNHTARSRLHPRPKNDHSRVQMGTSVVLEPTSQSDRRIAYKF